MGYEKNPIQAISTADIFCLTSNYEGMPNALIEALSLGLPCVSTKCGGGAAEELISDGINGLLINIDAESELVCALEKIAASKDFKETLGNNARNIINELSISKISSKWIEAIENT